MCKNEHDAHKHLKANREVVPYYATKPGYRLNQIRKYNLLRKFRFPNMLAWRLAGWLS